MHRWMLRDTIRNESYRRALQRVVRPGDVVLDFGAGTGILSLFAVQAGARKVYAVERTTIAKFAREMIRRNGCADRIEVLEGDLEDIELPEKVDVIVSEWMGHLGVDENLLAPLVIARNRWLKPGGRVIPDRVTTLMAPVWVASYDEDLARWRSKPHGLDMTAVADLSGNDTLRSQTPLTPADLVAPPTALWSHPALECTLAEADRSFVARARFASTKSGRFNAIATWFDAAMGDGSILTNAIGAPDTHWGRLLFPCERAYEVRVGTPIDVEFHCDPVAQGNCEFHWTVQVDGNPREEHDTRWTYETEMKRRAAPVSTVRV
jgi:precorrin-6B methylase 2